MTEEKNIICYICKICMEETELKNVYECPACHMIEEKVDENNLTQIKEEEEK